MHKHNEYDLLTNINDYINHINYLHAVIVVIAWVTINYHCCVFHWYCAHGKAHLALSHACAKHQVMSHLVLVQFGSLLIYLTAQLCTKLSFLVYIYGASWIDGCSNRLSNQCSYWLFPHTTINWSTTIMHFNRSDDVIIDHCLGHAGGNSVLFGMTCLVLMLIAHACNKNIIAPCPNLTFPVVSWALGNKNGCKNFTWIHPAKLSLHWFMVQLHFMVIKKTRLSRFTIGWKWWPERARPSWLLVWSIIIHNKQEVLLSCDCRYSAVVCASSCSSIRLSSRLQNPSVVSKNTTYLLVILTFEYKREKCVAMVSL